MKSRGCCHLIQWPSWVWAARLRGPEGALGTTLHTARLELPQTPCAQLLRLTLTCLISKVMS